mgnify:CR=1 FL=1
MPFRARTQRLDHPRGLHGGHRRPPDHRAHLGRREGAHLRVDHAVDAVPEGGGEDLLRGDVGDEGDALGGAAASLHIAAADPENLLGVDQDRITRAQRAGGEALREYYRLQMANAFPWCVAAMPIPSWAKWKSSTTVPPQTKGMDA